MPLAPFTLWSTPDGSRHFLVPDDHAFEAGTVTIRTPAARIEKVDADDLTPFEVGPDQAKAWTKQQLGNFLEEARGAVDRKLAQWREQLKARANQPVSDSTTATPEAATALTDLLKNLPRVIAQGLSGDPARLEAARKTMEDLQRRFSEAGIELDDRFAKYPDRIASIRDEAKSEGGGDAGT